MPLNQSLVAELQKEAANTRKMLERVPASKNDWKPHEKSMKLGRLATHVAELSGWVTMVMATDELDWANFDYKPLVAETTEDLLEKHDENVTQAIAILENCNDADFEQPWTMRNGEHIFFTMPKSAVLRTFAFNHFIHHR
ncbi:MAG: DinB family protein, partial [Bacteroidota bacterium]